MKKRIICICDHNQLFREGLRSLLGHSEFTVALAVETLDELIEQFDEAEPPVLVIYGIGDEAELPAELIDRQASGLDGVKLVLLANAPTADLLRAAAEHGVHAVLSRNISGEVLQRALDYVLLGQRLYPAPQGASFPRGKVGIEPPPSTLRASQSQDRARSSEQSVQLSEREAQILGCLVEGASNKQIARNLGITEATVKVHIKGLLRKLRVNNRTQAAVWGLHHQTTDPAQEHRRADPLPSSLLEASAVIAPIYAAS